MWMQSEERGVAAYMRIIHFEHRGRHDKDSRAQSFFIASLGDIVSVIFSCHREREAVEASGIYQQGRSTVRIDAFIHM